MHDMLLWQAFDELRLEVRNLVDAEEAHSDENFSFEDCQRGPFELQRKSSDIDSLSCILTTPSEP